MSLSLVPIFDGDPAGEPILFVQGWPDDASLWDEAVAALRADYRCVRVTLPNFDGNATARWGYTTEEIIEALVGIVREIATPAAPVTLVLHDWGAYWGHVVHHRCPELVAGVAGLDVAPHYAPGPFALAGVVAYQTWLLAAFVVGGPVGGSMSRLVARLGGAPHADRVDARMNYPYRNVFADVLSGRATKLTRGYWPGCRLLFVYGERKPFMFHSRAWVDHVRCKGGEVIALPCGHWVTLDRSFVGILTRWIKAPHRPS